MPRDKDGFLKEDTMRTAGLREQYATHIAGELHEATISHDASKGGFVVTYRCGKESHEWQYGKDLATAKIRFKKLVWKLGGRA